MTVYLLAFLCIVLAGLYVNEYRLRRIVTRHRDELITTAQKYALERLVNALGELECVYDRRATVLAFDDHPTFEAFRGRES